MTFPLTLIFMMLIFLCPQEWLLPWMYGWPVLDVVVAGALISLAFESTQVKFVFPRTPMFILIGGFFFAAVMSHVAHGYFQGMMDTISLMSKLCLFCCLLIVVTNSVQRLRGVIFVFLLGAVIMAIHAIMQERTGAGFAGKMPYSFYYPLKDRWVTQSLFFGFFNDPNDLGQVLAMCLPLVFAQQKRMNPVSVLLSIGVACLLAQGMTATQSRGTLVAVVASAACMIFLWLPSKWLPFLGGLALIGGLVACTYFGPEMLDQSARNRVTYWGIANRYFMSHPLFGGGCGMFDAVLNIGQTAHNSFVLCYTELGFLGYWFWFNMLTLGVIGCWRTRVALRNPKNEEQTYLKRVAGIAIAAMTGYIASSYFLSRTYSYPLFFFYAFLASIPVIAQRYLPEGHPPLVNFRKDVIFVGTLTSLTSLFYIYVTIVLLNKSQ